MRKYIEIILNSPAEVFKAVDAKSREDLGSFEGDEVKLAQALAYYAGEWLNPLDDDPEEMTWEENMHRVQEWARDTME